MKRLVAMLALGLVVGSCDSCECDQKTKNLVRSHLETPDDAVAKELILAEDAELATEMCGVRAAGFRDIEIEISGDPVPGHVRADIRARPILAPDAGADAGDVLCIGSIAASFSPETDAEGNVAGWKQIGTPVATGVETEGVKWSPPSSGFDD